MPDTAIQTLRVDLKGRPYDIHIGAGLIARLGGYLAPLRPTSIVIVSNEVVAPLYGPSALAACAAVAPATLAVLPDGETHKTLATMARVIDALVQARADRRTVLVALGGGVVGDLAGYAAASYMRGIRYVQVPTTLLAQVDSSVGGKTGVNHPSGKNLIGAFHQPSVVVADTDSLRTLPARELSAGLAEVIKHGLIADRDYFEDVVAALPALRALDPTAIARTIAGSCRIKAAVVGRDERESGERALLNLGHTFGHAIEALTGFTRWLHGEAVGCGLCLAADLSERLALIGREDVERVGSAVASAGLPVRIAGLPRAAAFEAMRADKKAHAGKIGFVVLERLGSALQRPVDDALVAATLAAGGFQ